MPVPDRPLEYVIKPLTIGNEAYGQIAVSYIDDRDLRVFGVGTRQDLTRSAETRQDCRMALSTLERISETYSPELGFQLADPCGGLELVKQNGDDRLSLNARD